ncbi:MAG: winged helix-turn-helix transcriptional regulator [Chitinivibrionales bacterium]|nr:winged helix-turn-helix transcriptional regulator [Chitinivibrionales bacterium]
MENVEKLQSFFQTLADSNRLKIITFIDEHECAVSDIVNFTQMSQPLVSHHLKVLREKGIVSTSRKGAFIFYQLANKRLLDALNLISTLIQGLNIEKSAKPMMCCPPWGNREKKRTIE